MIDRRPAAILRCLGTPDVVAGVNFARTHGLPLSIKGGGHNIAGLGMCDDGLALDMSLMRGVWVDPQARIARAQAGCLLGDVDRETQLHGLAAVLGFVSNTGIAGLTLGGGFGYLSRRYGWTCDTVRAIQVVTADGRILRASESEHPDLFWALGGGGGNFGVVTGFEYELFPVGPEVYAGAVAWPVEQAPAVIAEYLRACRRGSRRADMRHGIPHRAAGALDCQGVPRQADRARRRLPFGQPGRRRERCWRRSSAPATPAGDILQRRSYVSQQMLLDATQPAGRRYYWKSEYIATGGRSAARRGARARRGDRLAAFRDPDLSVRRRAQRRRRRPLPRRQSRRPRRRSISRPPGTARPTTRRTSRGRGRRGRTCAGSRPAACM